MPICGKNAQASRQRRARPSWRPTLDVDESVAAAVLARVESPRDRLALACVSRVWRRAAATPGAWGTCDLVLDGELGEKVTDERFERLMLYCGDVKHLEVRDAPEGFEGVYFNSRPPRSLAAKFASLTTVVLTGCESVDGASIVELMKAIGMLARPKKDRLRRLHVHGCALGDDEVATLSDCVSLGRLENYVAWSKEPHLKHDGFDVCVCLICDDVMPMSGCCMCYSCLDTCCDACRESGEEGGEEIWGRTCDGCPANVCDKAECAASLLWFACDGCEKPSAGNANLPARSPFAGGAMLTKDASNRFATNAMMAITYTVFVWLATAVGAMTAGRVVVYECVDDLGGCGTEMCGACANARKREFFCCSACDRDWCTVCDPELKQPVCRFCGDGWCEQVRPGGEVCRGHARRRRPRRVHWRRMLPHLRGDRVHLLVKRCEATIDEMRSLDRDERAGHQGEGEHDTFSYDTTHSSTAETRRAAPARPRARRKIIEPRRFFEKAIPKSHDSFSTWSRFASRPRHFTMPPPHQRQEGQGQG
jgi:hypothetical protein